MISVIVKNCEDILHFLDRAESDIRFAVQMEAYVGRSLAFLKFNSSNNKCFQVICMLGLYARWASFNGSTDFTLDSNCITLLATKGLFI